MDTLTSIKVFRHVIKSGSFVAAGERLDLSTASINKQVMFVERRLRVRLLNGNCRTLSFTEPGKVYFERCKSILEDPRQPQSDRTAAGSGNAVMTIGPAWTKAAAARARSHSPSRPAVSGRPLSREAHARYAGRCKTPGGPGDSLRRS
jgi:DNA-binding transcriptional LysR family regulator